MKQIKNSTEKLSAHQSLDKFEGFLAGLEHRATQEQWFNKTTARARRKAVVKQINKRRSCVRFKL